MEFWKKVIVTDESKFDKFSSNWRYTLGRKSYTEHRKDVVLM